MDKKISRSEKLFFSAVFLSVAIFLLVLLFNTIFLHIPSSSETYDCDDAALQMVDRFAAMGIKAVPVLGNIEMEGEKYSEINHAWVVIGLPFNRVLAFDWGDLKLDSQYYEYYPISRHELLQYVYQDFIDNWFVPIYEK